MFINITGEEFTIEYMRSDWADDTSMSPAEINAAADLEYAWLTNNTHEKMRGWSYTGTGFSGPARPDAVSLIFDLQVEATDYVIEHLDELRAEVAAEAAEVD